MYAANRFQVGMHRLLIRVHDNKYVVMVTALACGSRNVTDLFQTSPSILVPPLIYLAWPLN